MGRWGWGVLLGLAMLVASASASQHKTLSYEEAVSLAVDFYNQEPGIDHAFRLLRADPQPAWDMTSKPRQELRFVVRETVCPRAQDPPASECDFKDNGLVRNCTGLFSTERESPTVIITCDTVTPGQHVRVRRSGWWNGHKRRRGSGSRHGQYSSTKYGGRKRPRKRPGSGSWLSHDTPHVAPIAKGHVG
ncbi:cathelicidin-1 [Alligator sinensis]|uniref:Cathelicidin antimicrobial peptide CATH1 n=1 Tax=Alligator sinensis TaxID=38654 RepID=A0A1U7SSP2_ALLSI|nr:cathelicidin-1 [Alligator sinensis]ASN73761.1 cathelicidin antimicrobial peptide CATH1 precursor [Alligator sinensis]